VFFESSVLKTPSGWQNGGVTHKNIYNAHSTTANQGCKEQMLFRVINPYTVFQPTFCDAFSQRVHREFQAPNRSIQHKKTHKQEKARKCISKTPALSDDEYEIIDSISTEKARKDIGKCLSLSDDEYEMIDPI